jgi:hypothetical protein
VDLAQVQLSDTGFNLGHVAHDHPNQMIGRMNPSAMYFGLTASPLEIAPVNYYPL